MTVNKNNNLRKKTTRERRLLIVETAIECFIEKGFHQTSIRDIASRAEISLGNLYNHFENKNALIAEIAEYEARELDDLSKALSKISDPHKALDYFIDVYLEESLKKDTVFLTTEIISEGLRNPDIVPGFMNNYERGVKLVAGIIDRIHSAGFHKPALPASNATEFIFDLMEGFSLRYTLEQKKPSKKDIRTLRFAIKRLVDA